MPVSPTIAEWERSMGGPPVHTHGPPCSTEDLTRLARLSLASVVSRAFLLVLEGVVTRHIGCSAQNLLHGVQ
jgi:hypothetical protein